ncbi:hypothetical protein [Hyalangium versicolor]|uniref:hypothetical protein n=1 Tax=Hyalangium versicolor TaxID=2861190 RepID=UPI001CCC930D|nr:hypothetical protein [Hyalangium versicolor]
MELRKRWSAVTLLSLGLWLAACGKSEPEPGSVPAGGDCSFNANCGKDLLCMDGKCAALGSAKECTPGETRCNGGDVESCGTDGRGYEFKDRCAGRCSNGACVVQACTPNTTRCQDDHKTVEACAADGSGYEVVQTCDLGCASGTCSTSNGSVCIPGDKQCNNEALEACTPTGSAWAFLQFCSTGCDSASKACKAPACVPFSERCNPVSGVHEVCNATGTALTSAPCTSSEACVSGRCVPTVCTPGQTRCLDSVTAGVCSASGTGFNALSCASNQVCAGGTCSTIVCAPLSTQCKNSGTSQVCTPNGTGYVDVPCKAGTSCQAGVCVPNSSNNSCTAGSKRCVDALTLATCNAQGSGYDYATCGSDQTCLGSACEAIICSPGSSRCASASSSEVCDPSGTRYNLVSCGAGTACDAATGSCKAQVCTSGNKVCLDVATLGTCNSTGTGYAASGCGANKACVSGACQDVVCAPGSATCSNGTTAAICNATGTGSTSVDCAAQGKVCVAGACQTSGGVICVPGRLRCNGTDVEECKPDGTGYTYQQSCTTTCGNGACAGAACKPFTLKVSSTTLPADNNSTLLVSSDVITDSSGVPVPDGTLFTVAASNNTSGVLAADLDSATAGTQVASVNGKIDFVVKTGPGANAGQTATVTATTLTASNCKGTVSFQLVTSGTNLQVAEDFSRTSAKDGTGTTANWDVERAEAAFPLVAGLGKGEDGDLYVASGTFNINTQSNPANPARTFADAVAYKVTAFATDNTAVTLADFPAGLAVGDEVVLINLQGGSGYPSPTGTVSAGVGDTGNVGTYEILTIKSVNFGTNQLTFASPILKIYGATTSNATLTGQKIIVQRIPHYRNVTVSGTLIANPWDGALGGILFIKASGSLVVISGGGISMDARGYRSDSAALTNYVTGESYSGPSVAGGGCNANNGGGGPGGGVGGCIYSGGGSYGTAGLKGGASMTAGFTYGDALLSRWFMGSGGGRYASNAAGVGGGIIVAWADTLGVSGRIGADGSDGTASGGSAGGSVYLRANTMNVGQNHVTAKGGSSSGGGTGGVGRIRLDAVSLHSGDTTTPTHTAGVSASSAVRAQTLTLDNVSGAITKARVISSVQDTRGGTITYEMSANGGTNWKAFTPGDPLQSFDVPASDLRLRVSLTSDGSNRPLSAQGVSIEYLAP